MSGNSATRPSNVDMAADREALGRSAHVILAESCLHRELGESVRWGIRQVECRDSGQQEGTYCELSEGHLLEEKDMDQLRQQSV